MREALFRGAPLSAVLPEHQARPILQKIKMATLGEGLDVLDINLDTMEDLTGREDQVSEMDPLEVTPQPDRENSVFGSECSNEATSFSGFTEASASGY